MRSCACRERPEELHEVGRHKSEVDARSRAEIQVAAAALATVVQRSALLGRKTRTRVRYPHGAERAHPPAPRPRGGRRAARGLLARGRQHVWQHAHAGGAGRGRVPAARLRVRVSVEGGHAAAARAQAGQHRARLPRREFRAALGRLRHQRDQPPHRRGGLGHRDGDEPGGPAQARRLPAVLARRVHPFHPRHRRIGRDGRHPLVDRHRAAPRAAGADAHMRDPPPPDRGVQSIRRRRGLWERPRRQQLRLPRRAVRGGDGGGDMAPQAALRRPEPRAPRRRARHLRAAVEGPGRVGRGVPGDVLHEYYIGS